MNIRFWCVLSQSLLSIGVLPLLLEFILLFSMSFFSRLSDRSLLSLEVAIVNDLQTSHVFLLNSPETLLLFSLLLEELLLNQLLISLMKNGSLLFFIKSLEVIGLDSVRGQHWGHSGRIFSHQVMSQGKLNLVSFLISPILSLFQFSISFFLS